ncbi:cytochrome P450 [Archangium gephyra]|uniref:Cytochrome P450 n=1 Tax=Archangium gephyra TaxID=48 RepID=A0AAC8QIK6_9BACT|nr:cytochrome P450 [Archangium gephyra]AKJ08201.1 putative cytochrome P450 hydroxylase [Archangium gephyra]REG29933.1 cytochrome P450 [Archangium gephyra]
MSFAETYDFFSPEAVWNSRAFLHRMRTEDPVYWSAQFRGWVLTRYTDVLAAARDRRLVSPPATGWLDRLPAELKPRFQPARDALRFWAGLSGEQDHLDFQRALKKYFTPAQMDRLRPRVQRLTSTLLAETRDSEVLEVVEELARPLSASVIGELLGLPVEDRALLLRWSTDINSFFQHADLESLHRGQRSLLEMQDYMRPLIEERRRAPREDLVSVLVSQQEGFFAREPEAVVANCVMLLFSGHETTSRLISSGLLLLLEHSGQQALLRERPELMPSAIEEMLRWEGPTSGMTRVSREPLELGGRRFGAGETFVLVYRAASHDPEAFPEPDTFDITRQPNRHLSFGMGAFACLGSALTRMEAEVCFQALLEHLPGLRAAFETPDWVPLPPLNRRLRSLRVTGRRKA